MDLLDAPVTALARRLRLGEVTAVDLLEAHIQRIESVNPGLNALVADRFEAARHEAGLADARLQAAGPEDSLPPLLGVPCTIKEFLLTEGMPHTGGMLWRREHVANEDSTVTARIRAAGAIIMGVTNIPEGGLWMETYNAIYGRTKNPWNPACTSGGSSGGEGALVSSGASPFGIGSDVGGSIRIPAAFCGTVGHKPTGGLVPNTGHFPTEHPGGAGTYLCTGPLTRTVDDAWLVLNILAGPDGADPSCESMTLGDPAGVDMSDVVVYPMESTGRVIVWKGVRAQIHAAADALASRGATVKEPDFPLMKHAMDIWASMLSDMSKQSYCEILGERGTLNPWWELLRLWTGFGRHTWAALIIAGVDRFVDFLPGRKQRFVERGIELQQCLEEALGDNGVLLFPPYSRTAPGHWRAWLTPFDPQVTAIFNVMESPVTQVPAGFDGAGLPYGVQVVGARGMDHLTIACAKVIEAELGGWQRSNPPQT
jgi:fatty acid amide hydrolase 2